LYDWVISLLFKCRVHILFFAKPTFIKCSTPSSSSSDSQHLKTQKDTRKRNEKRFIFPNDDKSSSNAYPARQKKNGWARIPSPKKDSVLYKYTTLEWQHITATISKPGKLYIQKLSCMVFFPSFTSSSAMWHIPPASLISVLPPVFCATLEAFSLQNEHVMPALICHVICCISLLFWFESLFVMTPYWPTNGHHIRDLPLSCFTHFSLCILVSLHSQCISES